MYEAGPSVEATEEQELAAQDTEETTGVPEEQEEAADAGALPEEEGQEENVTAEDAGIEGEPEGAEEGEEQEESEEEEADGMSADEMQNALSDVMPLVTAVEESPLMRQILHWRGQGYSEEQIKEGIANIVQQGKKSEGKGEGQEAEDTQEFDSIEDQVTYLVEKQTTKLYDEHIKPIKEEYNSLKNTAAQQDVFSNNNNVLSGVLKKYGYNAEYMNDGQVKKMRRVMQDYYPGYDIMKHKLTTKQAELIIRDSLGHRKGAIKEARKSQNLVRQAGAPKVMGGRSSKTSRKPLAEGEYRTNVTLDQRIRNVKELFQ